MELRQPLCDRARRLSSARNSGSPSSSNRQDLEGSQHPARCTLRQTSARGEMPSEVRGALAQVSEPHYLMGRLARD
jgi:hypothetical protein